MSKGQLFLITGVVTVIVLILLKTSLNLFKIVENRRYLETGLETMEFRNIEDELTKSVQIGYENKQNITWNVNNFTKFARSSLNTRTVDLDGFFVESIYSNSTRLNVTVFNFLEKQIKFLNLTLNASTPQSQLFYYIDDGIVNETNFTFDEQGNYSLKIFYNTSYENVTEEITIPYVTGMSKFIGFFDLIFASSRGENRDRFTETVDVT